MTAPVTSNDVEAVQNYASVLTADADAWRDIGNSATVISEQLRTDTAAWAATWEPEETYGVAVDEMCARLDALAVAANNTATELDRRAETVVAESLKLAATDEQNAQALDNVEGIDILARGDYPNMEAAVVSI